MILISHLTSELIQYLPQIPRNLHRQQRWHVCTTRVANGYPAHERLHAAHQQPGDLPQHFFAALDSKAELQHLPMDPGMFLWVGLPQYVRPLQVMPCLLQVPRPQRPGVLRELRLVVAFQALWYVPVEFHVPLIFDLKKLRQQQWLPD